MNKKFSVEFQYLCQKKFIDGNWDEGSSILSALKVGKNFGFLPVELFTDKNGVPYASEQDRLLPYSEYIAKLQAIPQDEITRLLALTEKPLIGYAQVNIDAQSRAKAISQSVSGILTRFVVDQNWWVPSWNTADIDPLRAPTTSNISGHAIGQTYFDFSKTPSFELANTWGITWNDEGKGHASYLPTEAWIPYYQTIPKNVVKPTITPEQAGKLSDGLSTLKSILLALKQKLGIK